MGNSSSTTKRQPLAHITQQAAANNGIDFTLQKSVPMLYQAYYSLTVKYHSLCDCISSISQLCKQPDLLKAFSVLNVVCRPTLSIVISHHKEFCIRLDYTNEFLPNDVLQCFYLFNLSNELCHRVIMDGLVVVRDIRSRVTRDRTDRNQVQKIKGNALQLIQQTMNRFMLLQKCAYLLITNGDLMTATTLPFFIDHHVETIIPPGAMDGGNPFGTYYPIERDSYDQTLICISKYRKEWRKRVHVKHVNDVRDIEATHSCVECEKVCSPDRDQRSSGTPAVQAGVPDILQGVAPSNVLETPCWDMWLPGVELIMKGVGGIAQAGEFGVDTESANHNTRISANEITRKLTNENASSDSDANVVQYPQVSEVTTSVRDESKMADLKKDSTSDEEIPHTSRSESSSVHVKQHRDITEVSQIPAVAGTHINYPDLVSTSQTSSSGASSGASSTGLLLSSPDISHSIARGVSSQASLTQTLVLPVLGDSASVLSTSEAHVIIHDITDSHRDGSLSSFKVRTDTEHSTTNIDETNITDEQRADGSGPGHDGSLQLQLVSLTDDKLMTIVKSSSNNSSSEHLELLLPDLSSAGLSSEHHHYPSDEKAPEVLRVMDPDNGKSSETDSDNETSSKIDQDIGRCSERDQGNRKSKEQVATTSDISYLAHSTPASITCPDLTNSTAVTSYCAGDGVSTLIPTVGHPTVGHSTVGHSTAHMIEQTVGHSGRMSPTSIMKDGTSTHTHVQHDSQHIFHTNTGLNEISLLKSVEDKDTGVDDQQYAATLSQSPLVYQSAWDGNLSPTITADALPNHPNQLILYEFSESIFYPTVHAGDLASPNPHKPYLRTGEQLTQVTEHAGDYSLECFQTIDKLVVYGQTADDALDAMSSSSTSSEGTIL